MRITVINEFHNTETTIRKFDISDDMIFITYDTYIRIDKKLCGMSDCVCGINNMIAIDDNDKKYEIIIK